MRFSGYRRSLSSYKKVFLLMMVLLKCFQQCLAGSGFVLKRVFSWSSWRTTELSNVSLNFFFISVCSLLPRWPGQDSEITVYLRWDKDTKGNKSFVIRVEIREQSDRRGSCFQCFVFVRRSLHRWVHINHQRPEGRKAGSLAQKSKSKSNRN